MRREDDEREYRLRPRKPPVPRQSAPACRCPRLQAPHAPRAHLFARPEAKQLPERANRRAAQTEVRGAVHVRQGGNTGPVAGARTNTSREKVRHMEDTKAAGFNAQGE